MELFLYELRHTPKSNPWRLNIVIRFNHWITVRVEIQVAHAYRYALCRCHFGRIAKYSIQPLFFLTFWPLEFSVSSGYMWVKSCCVTQCNGLFNVVPNISCFPGQRFFFILNHQCKFIDRGQPEDDFVFGVGQIVFIGEFRSPLAIGQSIFERDQLYWMIINHGIRNLVLIAIDPISIATGSILFLAECVVLKFFPVFYRDFILHISFPRSVRCYKE